MVSFFVATTPCWISVRTNRTSLSSHSSVVRAGIEPAKHPHFCADTLFYFTVRFCAPHYSFLASAIPPPDYLITAALNSSVIPQPQCVSGDSNPTPSRRVCLCGISATGATGHFLYDIASPIGIEPITF